VETVASAEDDAPVGATPEVDEAGVFSSTMTASTIVTLGGAAEAAVPTGAAGVLAARRWFSPRELPRALLRAS